MMYAKVPAGILELLGYKYSACVWNYFAGQKTNPTCFYEAIISKALHLFYTWKLAVVMYNTKKVFVIKENLW